MRSLLFAALFLVACGDDDGVNNLPDAPLFQDAPAPDAPTSGVVTLTITAGTTKVPDVRVYFQNADSSLVSATTTDASGVASATMEPGGFVTAVDPFLNATPTGVIQHDLRAFAGVKPGDKLELNQQNGSLGVTFTLQLPVEPTATSYLLYAPCTFAVDVTDTDGSGGGTGPGGPLTLFGCGATTDFVIIANDANGQPIKSLVAPNLTLTEGGTIDLTLATYANLADTTWTYSNVPAQYSQVNIDSFLAFAHGPTFETFTSATLTGGSGASQATRTPAAVAGSIQVDLSQFFGPGSTSQRLISWGPVVAATAIDVANTLLPDFGSDPQYDPTAHTLAWTNAATGGQQPDFALADVSFNRSATPLAWRWQVVAPNTSPAVTFPVLPAPDDSFNVITGDSVFINRVTTAKVPNGYDAVRAHALSIFEDLRLLAAGPTGRVEIAEFFVGKARKRGPLKLPPTMKFAR